MLRYTDPVPDLQKIRKVNKASINRSSHQRRSIKKGVLKNFAKFTGKQLC